jgi:hypothetical protein
MTTPNQDQNTDPIKDKEIPPIPEPKKEGFFDFFKSNTKDAIAYLLLIVGLVLLFFQPFFGGILIGLVAGLYYGQEIDYLLKNGNDFIETQGMVRSIVLGITFLALFISSPGIFIGAALSLALKHLFNNQETGSSHRP